MCPALLGTAEEDARNANCGRCYGHVRRSLIVGGGCLKVSSEPSDLSMPWSTTEIPLSYLFTPTN